MIALLVACQPAVQTPVLQTVEVTREVTVIQEVTREVTRIVEIPVTVTPTPTLTLTPTITPTPSPTSTPTYTPTITPTPGPPVVTVLEQASCRFGPGGAYLFDYGLNATIWMEVIGRNLEGSWLLIEGVHGWNPCWVKADLVSFNDGGNIATHDIEIVSNDIILPYWTKYYLPPDGVQAFRSGDQVTIYWNAVWMTEDDYRGYLIEAWLCQDGGQVFTPIGYVPPLSENEGTLGIKVTDEPGCVYPSSARIYTVEKHGYTGYIDIPWPPN